MKPHPLGYLIESDDVAVFFGNRLSTPESLTRSFTNFSFAYLQQTHSDIVVCRQDAMANPEGDAHLTERRRIALCVRTADCLPVLLHDPETNFVAAIHAGWRGVENEIIRKTCQKLKEAGSTLSHARAWIGPHIGAASFEVGLDVAARLQAVFERVRSFAAVQDVVLSKGTPGKAHVGLLPIAQAQLHAEGIASRLQASVNVDTFTSHQHASFRRDAAHSGRQISLIALK